MRNIEILVLSVVGILAIGLLVMGPTKAINNQSKAMFESWKVLYGKTYESNEQHMYRYGVWMQNFQFVQQHNKKFILGEEQFEVEMNAFGDISNAEFKETYVMSKLNGPFPKNCTGPQAPTTNLPDSVDWTTKSAVTKVKNQGQCGSCWAFSTTGSLQSANFMSTKTLNSYSEQQLVDCSHSYGNQGCNGGLMDLAFLYVKDHGIALESTYPYKGIGGTCHYNETKDKAWQISLCTDVTDQKQLSLLGAVAQQPVSVAIEADHISFQLYKKGVYNGLCGSKLDHGVLAVGYGEESGKKFWKVKNSWGQSWGMNGYIMIERNGDGKGKCGIQLSSSFPIK